MRDGNFDLALIETLGVLYRADIAGFPWLMMHEIAEDLPEGEEWRESRYLNNRLQAAIHQGFARSKPNPNPNPLRSRKGGRPSHLYSLTANGRQAYRQSVRRLVGEVHWDQFRCRFLGDRV